jgi:uncharacterized protein (DUF849 family)
MPKVIITAAITGGIHTPTMSPYLPYKPEDIADQAIQAAQAGAAVVHIHARDPETGKPTPDLDIYARIVERIRTGSNVLICITTGGGAGQSIEERTAILPRFKPELASFNMGSINFGLHPLLNKYKAFQYDWEPEWLEFSRDWVFRNTFKDLEGICRLFKESGTKPELEIYDVGHLYNLKYLLDRELLKPPVYLQFVTGILGGIAATPYDLMTLHQTAERLLGGNYKWSVIGAGKDQFNICTMGALLGGNCRVGLEDNLFLSKGRLAKSNGEQVAKMKGILEMLGFEAATPDEAREILGIGNAW